MSLKLKLISVFFPERCPFCGKIIEAEGISCDDCLEIMRARRKPIIHGASGYRCVSSFVYRGLVRRMLIRVKFSERTQHLRQVAEILAEDIRGYYGKNVFDLVTYVPMHPKDMKTRGYNQSKILAKEISEQLDIPYAETLIKVKHTKKQHELSDKERKTNLIGAFELTDKKLIDGKRLLLVDDIVTSGETLGHCAKKLNAAKPRLICCATIARAGFYSKMIRPF